MIKVKDEKLLQDYQELCEKRDANRAAIEIAARSFAQSRNYDDVMTADFIAFVQNKEADGLTDGEQAKLALLSDYVEYVSDEVLLENEVAAEV